MTKKKSKSDQFTDLTWNDLGDWAGSDILSRGKNYQRQGRVRDLAVAGDGVLVAWVDGTERYATKVAMEDDGLPEAICTCPYRLDCKHGVAVVIEYLKRIEGNKPIPRVKTNDDRVEMLEDKDWDGEGIDDEKTISGDVQKEIDKFLKGKTKAQLIELINDIAQQYPEVALDIADRRQLMSGNVTALVTRLRREIQEVGSEPGWQNYWKNEGFTPDYSEIRSKLETLLSTGHADEVLALGQELVSTGIRQVEESHDHGETATEIVACMPLIVRALDMSSLDDADKLIWAVDAELQDQYGLCEDLAEYLHRKHTKTAWHAFADRLLLRLKETRFSKGGDDFTRRYERDRLSNWIIHALEPAGRKAEIIPLCEAEAKRTGSYNRLVSHLVSVRRYEEAERWIREGVRATKDQWPGTAAALRDQLREIRMRQKNWPVVAAIHVDEFVRRPSCQSFSDCKKAARKIKAWPKVRDFLLKHLETGMLPWNQEGWPLPGSGLDGPESGRKDRFPMTSELIEIAILEKEPESILYWYDQRSKTRYGRYGLDEDAIATAVQTYAPDRAVDIWKNKAERLIATVKPKAYREAGKYLRKAAKVMAREKQLNSWELYLKSLRAQHARKIRLMEVLDSLEDKPIINKRC